MMNCILGKDEGFTIIEIIMVIILTGILAGLFSQVFVGAIQMYSNHTTRKSALLDARRSVDMFMHDMREWTAFQGTQTTARQDFYNIQVKEGQFFFSTYEYYSTLRVTYQFTNSEMRYQQDADGNYSNQYVLSENVVVNNSQFVTTSLGGKTRITMMLVKDVYGKPMRMRTTVFPRQQGG